MPTQTLDVTDFSGGFTDTYLAGPTRQGQLYDNLFIDNNKKIYVRPGSVLRSTTGYQILSGNKRISHLFDHRDQIFEISENYLYYFTTSYQTLTGPTSNNGLGTTSTESNYPSTTFWNNHTLIVSDSFCAPVKVYKSAASTFQVRTAGLPTITAPTVASSGGVGVNNYIYAFVYYYTYTVYDGVVFEDFGPTVQVSLSLVNEPSSNTVNITNIPVISNGTVGLGETNYDTSNIKVKIYRTVTDGTVFKYVGQVTNGTTTYNDTASDASITNAVELYTTGDVVDNDPPPPAKYVHVANDVAIYAHVKEDGVVIPNRIRQSIRGDIDSCPESFFLDFQDEITGINSFQGTFIVFTKNATFRVDGIFDEQGRGGMNFLRISDTVGCVSNDSIVQTDQGLFFAAPQGFYVTDGYRVNKISHHLDATYKTIVGVTSAGRNIYGAFDKIENRIWWTTQRFTESTDNDSCFVLDLNFPIAEESTFTTISNGFNFAPSALLFQGTNMYRADTRGFLFVHDDEHTTDPLVDLTKIGSNWGTATIIYDYISCAVDFGSSKIRKFVPKILLTLSNISNCAVQLQSINDDGKSVLDLSIIYNNSNIIWGDPDIVWGDVSIIWNQRGLVEEKRMFPATGLRCNYKQIRITNAYATISKSDTEGTVALLTGANTATLNNTAFTWPSDPLDYYLSFENDSYDTQFKIIERNSDTVVTFLDPGSESPVTGNYKWLLKGYRKGEPINVLSYVLYFIPISESQKPYQAASDSGANA